MNYTTLILRMLLALFLSLLIGIERQWRGRAAGIRTNVLVALGSFLFASAPIILKSSNELRMAAQVVSGIGFLGAGVVIKDGANIRGLNTAATLWCNAAIGVLCALGLLVEASVGTLLILIINVVVRYITLKIDHMTHRVKERHYTISITLDKNKETILRTTLTQLISDSKLKISGMHTNESGNKTEITANVILSGDDESAFEQIVTRFSMEPGVYFVGYNKEDYDDEEN